MIMSIIKLRKRLMSNRGSVLFVVLVVMSILIIAATATYYVVNNQHASIEVHYSSEQSYQTGLSIMDAVSYYVKQQFIAMNSNIADGPALNSYANTLCGKMLKQLSVGDSFTANTDAFNQSLKNLGLGDKATVNIKRVAGPSAEDTTKERKYFEINVTSEAGGETTSITQLIYVDAGKPDPGDYFTRFLTCTGNRPEDVRLGCRAIIGDGYFENDMTEFMASAPTKIRQSLYASGSLVDQGLIYPNSSWGSDYDPTQYQEMVIGDNFTIESSAGTNVSMPYIFIGGDFIDKGKTFKVEAGAALTPTGVPSVYIEGDYYYHMNSANQANFFVKGDCHITNWGDNSGTYYVGGDLYLSVNQTGNYYVAGNVYNPDGTPFTGSAKASVHSISSSEIEAAIDASHPDGSIKDWNTVDEYIRTKTQRQSYETWDAEGYYNKLLSDGTSTETEINLAGTSTQNFTATEGHQLFKLNSSTEGYSNIVLDVSSADAYVYLNPDSSGNFNFGSGACNLVTKGNHSVILVLPENAKSFKMGDASLIGNMELSASLIPGKSTEQFEQDVNGVGGNYGNTYFFRERIQTENPEKIGDNALFKWSNGQSTIGNFKCANDDSDYIINTSYATAQSGTSGGSNVANNNLFLVTKSSSVNIDLSKQCSLFGYVYAPNAMMECNGSCAGPQIIGGMIVGNYSYQNPSTILGYVRPYDYGNVYDLDDPTDIVKYLMGVAGTGDSPAGEEPDPELQCSPSIILGYK